MSRRPHDRLAGGHDARSACCVVAGLAEAWQTLEHGTHAGRAVRRCSDRALWQGPAGPDQEHAFTRLRHVEVLRVEHEERALIAKPGGAVEQTLAYGSPARALGEGLDVLHNECAGAQMRNDVEEMIDMSGARVIRVHASDDRESLAGWPADHERGLQARRGIDAENVTSDSTGLEVGVVCLDGKRVVVDRPANSKPSAGKPQIEPAGAAVERDGGIGRRIHVERHSCRVIGRREPES